MKPREINELLIHLREVYLRTRLKDELNHSAFAGLCQIIDIITSDDELTLEEAYILKRYLHQNRPSKPKHPGSSYWENGYYWDYCLMRPRIAWLDKHIKKTTKNYTMKKVFYLTMAIIGFVGTLIGMHHLTDYYKEVDKTLALVLFVFVALAAFFYFSFAFLKLANWGEKKK